MIDDPLDTPLDVTPGPLLERKILAAVDLGSNSFHMVVARAEHGHLVLIDRLREMVRLGGGLDERGHIEETAAERALACLARFGQRLTDMQAQDVRAVGTNTLRKAKNAAAFVERAEAALGFPIDIVSGREEARLVYLGAAHSLPDAPSRRLVVDIGGGSTELIVGDGVKPISRFSLYMGCVGMTTAQFSTGKLSSKRFERARISALTELEPIVDALKRVGWEQAVGTSGTIRTTRDVLVELGLSDGAITCEGLKGLLERTRACGRVDALQLPGLSEERAPVYAGGLAILLAVFEALGIDSMRVSDGALREGLLFDMLGRMQDHDARDRSIAALMRHYQVRANQAARVSALSAVCLRQVSNTWDLDDPLIAKLLNWASLVHEAGLGIAHASYHKHGAYVVGHADLHGFSLREQQWLARMVLEHRRKIIAASFADLSPPWDNRILRATVLLRLAVLLSRSRSSEPPPDLRLRVRGSKLKLKLPDGWLEMHPLTRADLEAEATFLEAVNITLAFR